ncbi:unnamed protein product [Ambrosiozyma monospora]|uniref:Unnamed protein product n=1 Tax=Ambrosiozyma monospora TaxID=43982 RepID=A0ACB5T3T8_AMBMO|nr:unnamed protein product [Ambrosiozyma monospora]
MTRNKRGNKKRGGQSGGPHKKATHDTRKSFNGNPRNKRKGKKRQALSELSPNNQYPELEELETFTSMADTARNTRRKNRYGLNAEVDYTGSHREDTLKRPLRKMPIKFVKAAELYDPSAELFKRLANSSSKSKVTVVGTDVKVKQTQAVNYQRIESKELSPTEVSIQKDNQKKPEKIENVLDLIATKNNDANAASSYIGDPERKNNRKTIQGPSYNFG